MDKEKEGAPPARASVGAGGRIPAWRTPFRLSPPGHGGGQRYAPPRRCNRSERKPESEWNGASRSNFSKKNKEIQARSVFVPLHALVSSNRKPSTSGMLCGNCSYPNASISQGFSFRKRHSGQSGFSPQRAPDPEGDTSAAGSCSVPRVSMPHNPVGKTLGPTTLSERLRWKVRSSMHPVTHEMLMGVARSSELVQHSIRHRMFCCCKRLSLAEISANAVPTRDAGAFTVGLRCRLRGEYRPCSFRLSLDTHPLLPVSQVRGRTAHAAGGRYALRAFSRAPD